MAAKSLSNSKKYLRQEYIARINRVIDFIENNIGSQLNLEKLSQVACFSRFHFHRIFSAFTGETLNSFIKRLQVEKAASMLIDNPRYSITGIALDCGFSSSAAFSRAFREYFNMSASDFRNSGYIKISKNRKIKSKNGKVKYSSSYYINDKKLMIRRRFEMNVQVKELPKMHVVYCRHVGSYSDVGKTFEKLMKWAGPRGLIQFPKTQMLAVYHDDPQITEESKLRSSVCITVPEDTKIDGEIGKMTVSGGKYAVAHFEITVDQFSEAWDSVMRDWMPESGYQSDDRLCYELYYNNPKEHPEGKFIIDICVPVKPL